MSYRYPYGNTEQMNLDWFLNQWEKFKADWAEAQAGIDGSLDAEIAKLEAAMSELYAARDAAAASATAARQSSLDAAAAQVAAGNSKTAAQAAETAARGSQQAAAESAQEAQASATGAENSALTATQAANTATQQAAGADAAKGAAEAAQQAAEAAQAAAAQSAGQAGQAATAAGDHADDAADSATLAQQAAQDMSDSVEQIITNKNDISVLKTAVSQFEGEVLGGEAVGFSWQDGLLYNALESGNASFQKTGNIRLHKGDTISFTGGKGATALPVNALTLVTGNTWSQLKAYSGSTAEQISYTANDDIVVRVCSSKALYGNNLKVEYSGIVSVYIRNNLYATSYTLNAAGAVSASIIKGTKYYIKNKGTAQVSFSTRATTSGTTIDSIVVEAGNTRSFIASENANYIIANAGASQDQIIFDVYDAQTLIPFIDNTENELGNYGATLPLVRFNFTNELDDYSSELEGVNFTETQDGYYTIPDTIYSKFDSLVTNYSGYVTKIDAALDVGLTYPSYANLGGSASGDYQATPTYKTYLYKFETNNSYVNGYRNPKKKLFLIGATHGSEVAGAFNLYLFAKNLCEGTKENYFKFRDAYDVYIVPCLNGYGMYHSLRWNANGVNINRNYPIKNWAENGEPYTTNYTGPSPASEFETQLIIALQNKYKFDVGIDHHNYGASNSQFYTEFWYDRFNPFANAALADCSYTFIKELPTYFGTNYRLFVDIANSTRPNVGLSNTMACTSLWWYEQGIDFGATIEISNQINYIGGAVNTSESIPKYTADVFAVGEYTLMNQLCYYCGFVLGSIV